MIPPPPVEFDVAIVLGAKVMPDGSPSRALARRTAHAASLALSGHARHLLMSGGPVSHPVPEAHVMRDLALEMGVAPDRVHVETRSRDTIGNARQTVPILESMGWTRAVVVTDAYHLPRARLIFSHFGVTVAGIGARPDDPGLEWWWASLRERLALLKTLYRLKVARR
jgi:uncharacterized SAM-binding protein YcdF (DUF218 family)